MFGSKQNKSKLLAFAVVAMFAVAIIPFGMDDSDASPYGGISGNYGSATDAVYDIPISVGQSFTYNPTTNLGTAGYGTVKFAWTGDEDALNAITMASADNGNLSGSFDSIPTANNGVVSATLTATWTSPDDTGVTQTAKQTFNFDVSSKIILEDNITGYALVGEDGNLLKVGYEGGENLNIDASAGHESLTYTLDAANNKILVKVKEGNTLAKGDYTGTVTLSNTATGDASSILIKIHVADGIQIDGPTQTIYYTYEGATPEAALNYTISYDTDDDETTKLNTHRGTSSNDTYVGVNFTQAPYTITADFQQGWNGVAGSIIANGTAVDNSNGNAAKFTATVNVAGTVSGQYIEGEPGDGLTVQSTDILTVDYIVYKSFQFTSAPKVKNVEVQPVANGSNMMNLSAYIAGAKSVTFNWGDGTVSNLRTGDVANTYAANHTYAKDGMYMITITATNDVGTTTSKVMYAAGEGATDVPAETPGTTTDADKKEPGFFNEHGYLFLIFAIIGIGAIVAFLFYFNHPALIIVALVALILAAALYVYVDFTGIIEAVKDLFATETKA